ncbi:MAG: AMP nucleosidase [Alphaproteobacteria bacterium]
MTWSHIKHAKWFDNPDLAVDYVIQLYNESVSKTYEAFEHFVKYNTVPKNYENGCFYPFVGLTIAHENLFVDPSFAYGVISEPGNYGSTLTAPEIFDAYYREQISLIMARHKVQVVVGYSDSPIPLPFVIEHTKSQFDVDELSHLQSKFILPDLKRINDDYVNATSVPDDYRPLSLFSAERVDLSLQRLQHYTGTPPRHFQNFVLLTNYQRYIDEFISHISKLIEQNKDEDWELIGPSESILASNKRSLTGLPEHLPQMPAYHFKQGNRNGITFVNIGVGPSNAKTITDHIAVLRPHCWLMLGHCAGLRASQALGDYVLADGYVREDHVLDGDLPNWVPIPPIAEIQQALQKAVLQVIGKREGELKSAIRTGTVLTTDNRNWELQSTALYERFRQSRAIAVDMESATLAANGFRFRVPYGTLLCVSDKPIHGVIKLHAMANEFYRSRVHQHLHIGIEAMLILKNMDPQRLHSRKLRGFDECPFR